MCFILTLRHLNTRLLGLPGTKTLAVIKAKNILICNFYVTPYSVNLNATFQSDHAYAFCKAFEIEDIEQKIKHAAKSYDFCHLLKIYNI